MAKSRPRARRRRAAAPTERGENTRARLIKSAHKQFLRRGFHAASMRQIAEGAGIAVGGVYNHFRSKEEVFAAVLDAYHPYRIVIPALQATEGDTVEAFVRNAMQQIQAAFAGVEDQLAPLLFIELVEFRGRHLKELAVRLYPTMAGFMQRFLMNPGQVRDLPFPVVMRTLASLMIGYLITEMVLRNSPVFGQFDVDWYGGMVDIFLHGIVEDKA